jgi:Flp pilus assembly protein TadG
MIARAVRRLRKREEGASLVEFALIAPILFLILFGIIDFGFIYNDFLSLRQGVRDGARVGAVANFGTNTGCSASANTSVTPGTGAAASTEAQQLICTTRDKIGLDQSKTRVAVTLAGPQGAACPSTGTCYSDGAELVVCAMYPATSRSGFLKPFLGNGVVTTRVAIRVEQTGQETGTAASDDLGVPSGASAPAKYDYQEGALQGKNWNFCVP